jgi:hypothetical protein
VPDSPDGFYAIALATLREVQSSPFLYQGIEAQGRFRPLTICL